jgi:uncharacterized protein (UPF0303 family)
LTHEPDLRLIQLQEELLRFETFDETIAEELGKLVIAIAQSSNLTLTVLVRIAGSPVFVKALPGTSPANFYWANRKANLVELYGQSSYRLGLQAKESNKDLLQEAGLDASQYAAHGGGFPIRLQNGLLIGSLTVSGLPQRDDHVLASNAIASYLNVSIGQLK